MLVNVVFLLTSKIFILENKKIPSKQGFSQVPQDVMTELFKLVIAVPEV